MTTTLLAVDDSKTMRKVLDITFAGEDYNVVLAGNPAEAMAKLQSDRPAIVLADANLGAGNEGYDLCQQIKAAAPATRVLILSSKQVPYDRGRGSAAGADDHMDKPVDTQQLIDKVAAVMAQPATRAGAAAPQVAPAPVARPAPVSSGVRPGQLPGSRPGVAPMKQRPQTLAYGTPAPSPAGVAPTGPAPTRAAPAPAPAPGRTQTLTGTPKPAATAPKPAVGPAGRQFTPAVTPQVRPASAVAPKPAVSPKPAAVAPRTAAPAPAPAPSAAAAPAVAAATGNGSELEGKLTGLGLNADQVSAVLALSKEVVEQVVWEVVPILAETLIKEEIQRLTSE